MFFLFVDSGQEVVVQIDTGCTRQILYSKRAPAKKVLLESQEEKEEKRKKYLEAYAYKNVVIVSLPFFLLSGGRLFANRTRGQTFFAKRLAAKLASKCW